MLNKLKKGQRELSQELGRTPTVTELAEFVELPEDDVESDVPGRQPVSLEMKVGMVMTPGAGVALRRW